MNGVKEGLNIAGGSRVRVKYSRIKFRFSIVGCCGSKGDNFIRMSLVANGVWKRMKTVVRIFVTYKSLFDFVFWLLVKIKTLKLYVKNNGYISRVLCTKVSKHTVDV